MTNRRGTDVLIVDDDPSARLALERLLTGEGFAVRSAESARIALDMATNDPPEVIITDLRIVEAHGGSLAVESTLGSGSTFYFEIPVEGAERTSWRVVAPRAESVDAAE
jgi:response regulator RpfG family c-di-GMP phosphodiesterase